MVNLLQIQDAVGAEQVPAIETGTLFEHSKTELSVMVLWASGTKIDDLKSLL